MASKSSNPLTRIKENVLGTDEENAYAQELENRIAIRDPKSPQAKYQALLETGLNLIGQPSKKPEDENFLLNMGKGAMEGLKTYKEKNGMKSGGKVSSASARADGIAAKGKTRGKIC